MKCDHCDKTGEAHGVILVAMKPGVDGKAWWLCSKCHRGQGAAKLRR